MASSFQLQAFAHATRIPRQALLVFCVWTLIIGASLWWNERQGGQQVLALAAAEAKANLSRDLAFRRWATTHGGIYVPVDGATQPNPYLANIPERDVPMPGGGMLTLYNPATALREIMAEYTDLYGVKARITGLKVLNPIDRPSAWEEKALHAIEKTRQDFVEVGDIDGKPHLRMMQPMYMEEGCLKCHAWTGIKVGEIRGGTAVAVPLEPYHRIEADSLRNIGLTHGGIWLIGIGVIAFVSRRARRHAEELERAAHVLVESEERVRLLLDSTAEGLLATDMHGQCTLANPAAVRMLGYGNREQLLAQPLAAITRLAEAAGGRGAAPAAAPARSHADTQMFWRADGSCFPVEYWAHPIVRDADVVGRVVAFVDISDRRRTEQQLRNISRAVEQSAHGVMITDANGMIEYVNPKFTQINGYTLDELRGQTPRLFKCAETDAAIYRDMWQTLAAGDEWRGEFRNRRKDGKIYWCTESISPVKDDSGRVTHFVAVVEDVSERKHAEATIQHLAHYDSLTDLPNRRLLRDRLEQAVAWSHRSGNIVALLYLDLDRFKFVNDTLGHPIGDGLLNEVGKRVSACVRENDTVARLGGDEFAVVVADMQRSEDAGGVAEKILAALDAPFRIEGHELYVSTSIGISLFPVDTHQIDELIRNADIAMYQAKDKGKATFQYYDQAINALTVERLELEHGLRKAIEHGELFLEYQPKLDLRSGAIVAVEALVRWNHPTLGRIPPDRFIPLAEEIKLIAPLGEWVLRTACAEAGTWHADGSGTIGISVNLSPLQFRRKGLLDCIGKVLADTGFPAHRLELEITESALMDDPEAAASTLLGLRALGVTVSIDDFGTGYSSLGHLKRFPVSVLKIDRSFVRDITVDQEGRAIAEAVIALARSLHLSSIAEGVETADQLDILRTLGCDAIQGYYVGRPMAPAELLRQLAQRQPAVQASR